MKGFTELELAYFAGFFDGEGCISIARQKKSWGKKEQPYFHRLRINIAQKDPAVLKQLHDIVGGTLHCNRGIWKWYADDAFAVEFLTKLRPYLRVKASQADIAIEFTKTKKGGYGSITAEVFKLREDYCVAVRAEKDKQYA
jgi:hypothetical protein